VCLWNSSLMNLTCQTSCYFKRTGPEVQTSMLLRTSLMQCIWLEERAGRSIYSITLVHFDSKWPCIASSRPQNMHLLLLQLLQPILSAVDRQGAKILHTMVEVLSMKWMLVARKASCCSSCARIHGRNDAKTSVQGRSIRSDASCCGSHLAVK
jgi:hypothetical protein